MASAPNPYHAILDGALLSALESILDGTIDTAMGICGNVRKILWHRNFEWRDEVVQHMSGMFPEWEGYSGDPVYPVYTDKILSPHGQYNHTPDVWAGEYGDARRDLLCFLIATIRQRGE